MADFAEDTSDRTAGRRLTESLRGQRVFRRFKNLVYDHYPELVGTWHALRDVRAERRAVDWLAEQGLIDEEAARQFAADHPDPGLP